MPHFWLYPLLAAPAVKVALLLGVSPLWGFVALHAMLLGALCALVLARPAPIWTSLLLLSPLMWWIDKPSPDVLLVSCLAGAMLLWTTRPTVSLILLGVGASQNPGLVLVAALFAAWGSIERPARLMCRRWQTGVLGAALLIALPAAYYLWRLGIPSPLTAATITRWPGLFDALFPFSDVSVGLVFRYPPFVVAVLVAADVAGMAGTLEASRALHRHHGAGRADPAVGRRATGQPESRRQPRSQSVCAVADAARAAVAAAGRHEHEPRDATCRPRARSWCRRPGR